MGAALATTELTDGDRAWLDVGGRIGRSVDE
jgi:hypothetical protein